MSSFESISAPFLSQSTDYNVQAQAQSPMREKMIEDQRKISHTSVYATPSQFADGIIAQLSTIVLSSSHPVRRRLFFSSRP
jgi:hypothetical protein